MRTITIQQVIATHQHEWAKWPDTADRDYSSILAWRGEWRFTYPEQDLDLVVVNRYLPVFKAYLDAKDEALVVRFPWIDNTMLPSEQVRTALVAMLADAAHECVALRWEHAHQCTPPVAAHLREMFRLTSLNFGDDCPGSSEIKTWPVAHAFDALLYTMFVWDFASGQLTAPLYEARGVGRTYHIASGETSGLSQHLSAAGFSVEAKAEAVARGEQLPVDFVFVGMANGFPWRQRLMDQINAAGIPSMTTRLHGVGMRDGEIGDRFPYQNAAPSLASLYPQCLLGVNPQQSSLFNTRLVDLWRCGIVQLIHDPWGELEHYDIRPREHYVAFDGSYEGLVRTVQACRENSRALAPIIRAGAKAADRLSERASWVGAHSRLYLDHLTQLEQGRS